MFRKIIFGLIISFVFTPIAFGQKKAAKVSVKNNSQIATHQTLDEKIKAELANFHGNVWIYAKNLDTGRDYALRADEQVRTASTIKLAILTEVFAQIEAGKIKWTDEFVLTNKNKFGGSGVLSEFSDGTKIDLKTATNLMIVISDNTATNLILAWR